MQKIKDLETRTLLKKPLCVILYLLIWRILNVHSIKRLSQNSITDLIGKKIFGCFGVTICNSIQLFLSYYQYYKDNTDLTFLIWNTVFSCTLFLSRLSTRDVLKNYFILFTLTLWNMVILHSGYLLLLSISTNWK
jgi:hypothetical protein